MGRDRLVGTAGCTIGVTSGLLTSCYTPYEFQRQVVNAIRPSEAARPDCCCRLLVVSGPACYLFLDRLPAFLAAPARDFVDFRADDFVTRFLALEVLALLSSWQFSGPYFSLPYVSSRLPSWPWLTWRAS